MDINEPKELHIAYPIVPESIFKHHTDDLESMLSKLIYEIHSSKNLEPDDILSHSAHLSKIAIRINLIISNYQIDLIHAYTPTQDDEHPDYM